MNINLHELKKLAEAATRGPWKVCAFDKGEGEIINPGSRYYIMNDHNDICYMARHTRGEADLALHDAAFIATASPAVVLALIEQIERIAVERDGANHRAKMLLAAKNNWAERAQGSIDRLTYLAAGAPAEPQAWFRPVIPDECKNKYPYLDNSAKYNSFHDAVTAEANWAKERQRLTLLQWPFAWARAVLEAEETRAETVTANKASVAPPMSDAGFSRVLRDIFDPFPSDPQPVAMHIYKQADVDALRDAARYRYLRERDLDTIDKGGVFGGMTTGGPTGGYVLNQEDLDAAVDAAMAAEAAGEDIHEPSYPAVVRPAPEDDGEHDGPTNKTGGAV